MPGSPADLDEADRTNVGADRDLSVGQAAQTVMLAEVTERRPEVIETGIEGLGGAGPRGPAGARRAPARARRGGGRGRRGTRPVPEKARREATGEWAASATAGQGASSPWLSSRKLTRLGSV